MIFYENKTEEVPLGRYTQKLDTQFVTGSIPNWISVPASTTFVNNGIMTPAAETVINTSLFDVSEMDQLSIELFNIRYSTDSVAASIKMINEDEKREIGFCSDSSTSKNIFKIIDSSGNTQLSDNTVGYMGDVMKFRFMAYTSSAGYFATKPRNLRLSVMPGYGYAHILENGIPSYTRRDVNTYMTDWSGKWRFRITSAGYIAMSGCELMIQQNI